MNNNQNLNGNDLQNLNTNMGSGVPPVPETLNDGTVSSVGGQNLRLNNPVSATSTISGQESLQTPPVNSINLQPEGVVQPLPQTNVESVPTVQPLMGMDLSQNSNVNLNQTPGINPGGQAPMNPMPNNSMGMVPPNNINNVGMLGGVPVPPTPEVPVEEKKKKPKISKPLIIILVVVLIAAVGIGVYYFLNTSKKKNSVVITPLISDVVELGANLPKSALYYVKVSGMSASECTLNTNINTAIAGTYEWSVQCGSITTGVKTVNVKDTQPPVVTTKDVVVVPDSTVTVEQFIDVIEDASEVTYDFEDEDLIDTSTVGTYTVNIVASDAYSNETVVTANLIVDVNAPVRDLYCEYEDISSTYETATINVTFKYGINSSSALYDQKQIVEYTFDEEEYETALADISDNGFDGWTGTVTTNDTYFMIKVEVPLTTTDLNTEFNISSFPTTESEIEKLHTDRGDLCSSLDRS